MPPTSWTWRWCSKPISRPNGSPACPRSQPARQLVRAGAVLGTQASAKLLWQGAEVEVQAGVEALEEAIGSGLLRAVGAGAGRPGNSGFAPVLIRDGVYPERGAGPRRGLSPPAPR